MKDFDWTDEHIGVLTRLWSEGLSARQIAAEFGINRNAVIGKAYRLKLPAPAQPKPQKSGPVIVQRVAKLQDAPPILPSMPKGSDIPTAQRCTLLQLTSGVCKWPFGEPQSPDFFFCGGDALEGKPYCAEHCRVAYRGYWN